MPFCVKNKKTGKKIRCAKGTVGGVTARERMRRLCAILNRLQGRSLFTVVQTRKK